MKKKMRWKVLIIAVIASLVLGFIQSKCDKSSPNIITNTLSIMALPSLIISCLVLIDINDVKKKVERNLNYQGYLIGRNVDERDYFFEDYRNIYLVAYSTLEIDLRTLVLNYGEKRTEEFVKRVRKNSFDCLRSIESYSYIESCIKILESNMEDIDTQETERRAQNEAYKYTTNKLKVLKRNLEKLYNQKVFESELCEELIKELVEFKHFCDYQRKEIESKFYLNDNSNEKEMSIDEEYL